MGTPSSDGTRGPPLEYAPVFTFSTIQTGDDVLDTIITSILVTFILSNLNSMIVKIISRMHSDRFNFDSYLRLYIFNASDDLTRIYSWLKGENTYLSERHRGTKKQKVIKRLYWPLFARAIIFTAAILSIALAVPTERDFADCAAGDYQAVFVPNVEVDDEFTRNSLCVEIELILYRGTTSTTLNFCSEEIESLDISGSSQDGNGNWVIMKYDQRTAVVSTVFHSDGVSKGLRFYIEWGFNKNRLRSRLTIEDNPSSSLTLDVHRDFVMQVIKRSGASDCEWSSLNGDGSEIDYVVQNSVTCGFNTEEVARIAGLAAFQSVRWRFLKERQQRLKIPVLSNASPSLTFDCPLVVSVSRPIVNIVPLCVAVLLSFVVNRAVGVTVSEQGNVDDATYHLIREALNLDVTCNPLEEPMGSTLPAVPLIPYKTYQCDGVHTHGGFLKAPGDVERKEPVTDDTYFGLCIHRYRGVPISETP